MIPSPEGRGDPKGPIHWTSRRPATAAGANMPKSTASAIRQQSAAARIDTFFTDLALRLLKEPSAIIGLEVDRALAELADIANVDRCELALFSPDLGQL